MVNPDLSPKMRQMMEKRDEDWTALQPRFEGIERSRALQNATLQRLAEKETNLRRRSALREQQEEGKQTEKYAKLRRRKRRAATLGSLAIYERPMALRTRPRDRFALNRESSGDWREPFTTD